MPTDPTELLPLKADVLLILTAIARKERYGYAIMQEAERLSGGTIRLLPGVLYRRLAWMLDEGLIEELDERPVAESEDDERRRYYGVTPFGVRVAAAEAERMTQALDALRELGLAGGGRA
jgi:DNA-binding PadR family transcriptional regulator